MNEDIASLITACNANENAGWSELLQICTSIASNLHRFSYRSLTPEDTENIISNICTRLIDGGLRNFRGESKYELLGFIRTIVRNETISYIRANRHRNSETNIDQAGDNDDESSLLDRLEDNSLRPDTIAEINDLYRRALSELSLRDKQILIYKIEGYKEREIAEILEIPMGTVAVSNKRAKELLRQMLISAVLVILYERISPWMTSL